MDDSLGFALTVGFVVSLCEELGIEDSLGEELVLGLLVFVAFVIIGALVFGDFVFGVPLGLREGSPEG